MFVENCIYLQIMKKLLVAAVSDADVSVQRSVFLSLHENNSYDEFLAHADSLFSIFVALNDEDFDVLELAISIAGRLSEKNPAYVLSALRRHLIQLLTYLGHSTDSKCREESAKLLGCLIRHSERLVIPYIAPIHKALVARLREGTGINANNAIVTGVLATVGELAKVPKLSEEFARTFAPLAFEDSRMYPFGELLDISQRILNNNPSLYFYLQQQKLIELIQNEEVEEAQVFAREELAPIFFNPRFAWIPHLPKLSEEFVRTFALLPFEDSRMCSFGELSDISQRIRQLQVC